MINDAMIFQLTPREMRDAEYTQEQTERIRQETKEIIKDFTEHELGLLLTIALDILNARPV